MNKKVYEKIKTASTNPGVYLFKKKNKIIYIGKAINLRKRLLYYLKQSKDNLRYKNLVAASTDLEMIVTNSDIEALTLEESLIKLNKPRYNVRLKDDKKFPYLKITLQDEYPRIIFTRDLKDDGSIIFGPYTNARAVRRTRDALCRIFKLVSCNKDLNQRYKRACLEYDLGRCSAPCIRQISKEDYKALVRKAIKFLRGDSAELEKEIEELMWQYAKVENFEAAAALRNQLLSIRQIIQHQQIVTNTNRNCDVIGFSRSGNNCIACLLIIRKGRLLAREIFALRISSQIKEDEIAASFIRLIYTHLSFVPQEIIISAIPRDWEIQSRWFEVQGTKVKILTGKKMSRGDFFNGLKKMHALNY